jgi:DNA (cytosine-5)-methyltransferase 1
LSRKAIAGLERRANDRKKILPQMLNDSIKYMQTEFWDFAEGLDRETLVVPYGLCEVLGVINDQGGERMDISQDITGTLRSQDHGHPPLVSFHLQQDPIIGEDVSPCLGGQKQASIGVAFYDYHGQDKRITELDDVSPTCVRQWGTGGNNVPLVAMAMNERQYAMTVSKDVANTLTSTDYKGVQLVVYGICSNSSNSMKSGNPYSGIYEADTARTLDSKGGEPTCNQGGMIICFEAGAMSRVGGHHDIDLAPTLRARMGDNQPAVCIPPPSTIPLDMRQAIKSSGKEWDNCGSGIGEENGKMYTLTSAGIVHGVVIGAFMSGQGSNARSIAYSEENAPTLRSEAGGNTVPSVAIAIDRAAFNQGKNAQYTPGIDDSGTHFSVVAKGPGAVCFRYLVRRLTPKECERLQGYSDDYTKFGANGKIISDAARYRAIGNSIALPCMDYVMAKIAEDNKKRG